MLRGETAAELREAVARVRDIDPSEVLDAVRHDDGSVVAVTAYGQKVRFAKGLPQEGEVLTGPGREPPQATEPPPAPEPDEIQEDLPRLLEEVPGSSAEPLQPIEEEGEAADEPETLPAVDATEEREEGRGDRVELYPDAERKWRWRRVAANGEIVADSAQGYTRKSTARSSARRQCPDLGIEEAEG